MKQTAVEWLVEKLDQNFDYVADTIIEQAKAMEKEQITEAYDAGLFDGSMDIVKDRMYKKYYNETYGGNK
jgi:hypothetical protein